MGDFRKLKVWQKARALTSSIYHATAGFPTEERFGLTAQMRRAAVSITSNIAEGCGRNRHREFIHFLRIAYGSATELESQILIAKDQRLLDATAVDALHREVIEVQKLLTGLIRQLIAHSS